jgi:hypothetical protein
MSRERPLKAQQQNRFSLGRIRGRIRSSMAYHIANHKSPCMASRVVAWWWQQCARGAAIQEVNDARDPAELQAALQKRELKEYGQRIGRAGGERSAQEVAKESQQPPPMAAARYNILSSY